VAIRYTNTRRDLLTFAAHHHLRSPLHWFTLGVIALLVLPVSIDIGSRSELGVAFTVVFSALAVLVFEVFAVLILAVVTSIAVLFQGGTGTLTEHVVDFDGDGITESTDVNSGTTKWSGVRRVRRTRGHIFVYVGPGMAHVIPRRSVDSDQAWTELGASLTSAWRAARA